MEDKPFVSVVMPTFNESVEIITKSIQSVLDQSYKNWELFIVDDSTNIDTIKAIDSFKEYSQIRIERLEERLGVCKARNLGMRMSKGDFIAFLDGDDIALPDRLNIQVDYLLKHQEITVVGGAMHIIDEGDNIVSRRKYPSGNLKIKLWSLFRNPLAQPTVMMRRCIVDEGYLYDINFKRAEDLELWLRLMKNNFQIDNVSATILKYRICGDLTQKRRRDNWVSNYQARRKNISWSSPCYSIISVCVSFLYTIIPFSVMRFLYQRENNILKK